MGTLTTWLSATAGAGASLAIKTDGTLWAWGYNYYGQLGDGTNVSKSSPVQVGTLTTWSSVSTGGYTLGSTLAIKADGTLWAWGHNGTGQLGLGDGAWRSSPVQVGALTTWSKVYAGAYHTLAIKTDGTLWAWGDNTRGELGQGDNTTRYSPVQVGSMTYWSSASSGPYVTGGVMIGGWSMALQNAYVDP